MQCISIQFPVVVGEPIWSHWWDERTPIVENPGESVTCYSFWLGIDADYEARPNDWNTPDEDAFDGWYAAPADWYEFHKPVSDHLKGVYNGWWPA